MNSGAAGKTLPDDYEPAVLEAQIDHLFRQLPRLLIYSALVSVLLSAMLRNAVPAWHIALWLSVMTLVMLTRWLMYSHYRRNSSTRHVKQWANFYVILAGVSGLVWGLAGILLFAADNLELQSLILLVLAGMGAGSASVLPMYLPAFYVYLPASMIPAGVMMFLQGDQFHVFMGVFDFVFLFGVLAFGRAIGDAFKTSLRLRFENVELVSRLEQQKDELMIANQAKSRFLAAASHDLRQPLHTLSLFSVILGQKATDPKIEKLSENITASVGVLERLFSALLDISRIDAGVLQPEIERFEIDQVVQQVYADCLPMAQAKGLELNVDCDQSWTESDPTLLDRILRNLVTNAIHYTHSGHILIRSHASKARLLLSVEDTGIGIPQHQQKNVFEEFTQLHNPERDRQKGLGLGLSIVQRLAVLLGHPLGLESEVGKGSKFTLILPVVEVPSTTGSIRAEPKFAWPQKLGLRILVVDDDEDILEATLQLLGSWGCTVLPASNEADALNLATQSLPIDAVIADFRLPGHARGTQVIEKVRQIAGSAIPALLITGDMEPARLREAQHLGLMLLHKPVAPARLRAWLQKVNSLSH